LCLINTVIIGSILNSFNVFGFTRYFAIILL
jgi:hypothetical protein